MEKKNPITPSATKKAQTKPEPWQIAFGAPEPVFHKWNPWAKNLIYVPVELLYSASKVLNVLIETGQLSHSQAREALMGELPKNKAVDGYIAVLSIGTKFSSLEEAWEAYRSGNDNEKGMFAMQIAGGIKYKKENSGYQSLHCDGKKLWELLGVHLEQIALGVCVKEKGAQASENAEKGSDVKVRGSKDRADIKEPGINAGLSGGRRQGAMKL